MPFARFPALIAIGDQRLKLLSLLINGRPQPFDSLPQLSHGDFISLVWHQDCNANAPIQVAKVVRIHDELDTHFLLPVYDLPVDFPWLPSMLAINGGPLVILATNTVCTLMGHVANEMALNCPRVPPHMLRNWMVPLLPVNSYTTFSN